MWNVLLGRAVEKRVKDSEAEVSGAPYIPKMARCGQSRGSS